MESPPFCPGASVIFASSPSTGRGGVDRIKSRLMHQLVRCRGVIRGPVRLVTLPYGIREAIFAWPGTPSVPGEALYPEGPSPMTPTEVWSRQSREAQGMMLSLTSAACMGITYVASKYVLRSIHPETFVVFWFAMGSLYSLILLMRQGKQATLVEAANPWKEITGVGLSSAVSILLFFYAIQLIDPAIVSFYTRADNVFAVLMGVVFLRERFNSFEGLGVGIALLGSLVTTYRGGQLLLIGLGLCLLSSLMEGITVILVKMAVRRVSPLVVIFYRSLLASAIALVYGLATGRLQMPAGGTLAIIAAASLAGSFLANVTFYASLARIDVTRATAIKTLQPFFVLVAAYLVFTTLPTSRQVLGGAIIVTGILCLLYGRRLVRRAGEGTLVFEP